MRVLYWILIIAFAAFVVAFALQNLVTVTVAFFGYTLTAPLAALIAGVYFFGMVSGGAVVSFVRHSLHKATATRSQKASA